jgi:hypothetical protein
MCQHAWMARRWGTSGLGGRWSAQTPRFKDVSKVGNGVNLGYTCGRCRPCEGFGNNLEAMDDSILCGWYKN